MSKKKHRRPKPAAAAGAGPKAPAALSAKELQREKASADRKRRRRRLGVAAGVVLAAAAAVAAFLILRPKSVPVVRDPRMNVLLVTLDTTRADRLGCYGYPLTRTPNLDALAKNGVLFQNAYCPVPLTLPSHASIFTGLTPSVHGVHNNGSYVLGSEPATLAEVLKARGYATAAFTASFSVDSRFGLDRGFDVYDDAFQADSPFKAINSERKAEAVFKSFEAWFDKKAAGDKPFFAWVHFFDPHLPYNPPMPYAEEFAARPYDGEVTYMDYIFGLIMRKLEGKGLIGRTLIIAAGDHGESFGEKGESGHGVFLYEPAVRVPLLMYAEGHLPGGVAVPSRVRLIDVMPTILDLVEAPVPDKIQGTSLVSRIQGRTKSDLDVVLETFYPRENFGWAALTGLISKGWKYVRAPKEELYDLAADPDEKANAVANQDVLARLRAGLNEALRGAAPGKPGRSLTAEEQARLRSLGYVDYTDPKAAAGTADPKDRVGELKMIQDAERLEFEGRVDEAAALHAQMLALRPNAASSYINLALAQARLKKFDEAVATLKMGLEKLPGSELIMTRLGYTYLVTGQPEKALQVMQDVLKVNPRSLDALTGLAMILDGMNRDREARDYFEQALSVEPENKFLRVGYAGNLVRGGMLAEGIAVYDKLVKDFPQDPALYRMLGIAYGMGGNFDSAIENFKQILFIAPNPDAYFNLALCYRQKGDIAEAVNYLEKYLADTKGEPEGKVQSARAELARLRTK